MLRHDIIFTTVKEGAKLRRIVFATDLHLDAAGHDAHQAFFRLVEAHEPHFVLIGGDVSNGRHSLSIIKQLQEITQKPIYFVLGNHDYYYGSIDKIREDTKKSSSSSCNYLTASGPVALTERTVLIGHDCWADGREGDFLHSNVSLNDYLLIDELKDISPQQRLDRLGKLGEEAAVNIEGKLQEALQMSDRVILLTHTPIFRESCRYKNHVTDDNWAPHFVCKQVGERVKEIMRKNPDKNLLVLSGHSHHSADVTVAKNIRALVGEAEYGQPTLQGIVHIA